MRSYPGSGIGSPSSGGIFDPALLEKKIADLESLTARPDLWDRPEEAQALLKELEATRAPLKKLHKLEGIERDLSALFDLLEEGEEEALPELKSLLSEAERELEEFEITLLMGEENSERNAIVTIQAGAGGTEAQDWAEMLLRMITRYAERQGFKVTLVDENPGEGAGIKSATLRIEGPRAYGYLKSESGVHRLVRISPFDANARRHTSFAAISVLPEIEDNIEVKIDEKDLRIETFRSSGHGGQHVNTTDSAVRITHIPTGIVVTCQNERSQHQNRATAMKILRSRLYDYYQQEREAKLKKLTAEKRKIEWGSQIRSYVLHPYQLVKDHRTEYETSRTREVLDGELEPLVYHYLVWKRKNT